MKKTTTQFGIVAVLIGLLLTACSPSAQKKATEISALEKALSTSAKQNLADTAKVKQLLAGYEYYYTKFPTDSLSPIYLMRSGDFNRAIGLPDKAIACYHKVYTEFPNYPRANFGLFLEGFTYETDKHDLAKAKEAYTAYLTKYPDTKMAKDVKFLIDHLGMTPEQIMAEMDSAKRNVDTTATAKK